MKNFSKFIPTLYEPWFPLNIHKESYLDIFPKEQLVYLTPHCREEMTNYDPDIVYIIGGMVDKVNHFIILICNNINVFCYFSLLMNQYL